MGTSWMQTESLGKSHLTVGKIASIFLGLRTHLDKVSNAGKTAKQPAGSGCAGAIIPSRSRLCFLLCS